MKSWIQKYYLVLTGIVLGAVAGYIYWQQIGCVTGTCMITSKWHNSTAYGAVMGGLLFSMFTKKKKGKDE